MKTILLSVIYLILLMDIVMGFLLRDYVRVTIEFIIACLVAARVGYELAGD